MDVFKLENALEIEFKDYNPLLETYGIEYMEKGVWLIHGNSEYADKWMLFLSVRTKQTIELLHTVLPVLKKKNVSFAIIKDQLLNYLLNSGKLGFEQSGKVLTLFTKNTEEAIELANILVPLTDRFKGPFVPKSIRVGKILYAVYCERIVDSTSKGKFISYAFYTPDINKIPFVVEEKYLEGNKRRRLKQYV